MPPHHPLKSGPDDPCQLHGAQPGPSRDLRHCRIYTQLTARLKLPPLSEHVVLPSVWAQMEPGASEAGAWRMWTAFSHKNSCNCTREPSEPTGRTLRLQGTGHQLRTFISKWQYGHSVRHCPPLSSEAICGSVTWVNLMQAKATSRVSYFCSYRQCLVQCYT